MPSFPRLSSTSCSSQGAKPSQPGGRVTSSFGAPAPASARSASQARPGAEASSRVPARARAVAARRRSDRPGEGPPRGVREAVPAAGEVLPPAQHGRQGAGRPVGRQHQRHRAQEDPRRRGAHPARGMVLPVQLDRRRARAPGAGEAVEVRVGQGHHLDVPPGVGEAVLAQQAVEPLQVGDRLLRGHAHGDAEHQSSARRAAGEAPPRAGAPMAARMRFRAAGSVLSRGCTVSPGASR